LEVIYTHTLRIFHCISRQ